MTDDVFDTLATAFEQGGGCGHDLPEGGLKRLLAKWEEIRTPELIAQLRSNQ